MAEHSPAPFKAVHSWDAFIYIDDAQGRSVAAMQRRGPNAIANAYLFEAAPDLLAAAEAFLTESDRRVRAALDKGWITDHHDDNDVKALRAAAAKARGEAISG